MDFGGRYLFGAKRAEVWAALNDVVVLKAVISGCERILWTGPSSLEITIKVNFGIVHPTFEGDLALSDIRPAERYTLSGRGRGKMLGLANASAEITLTDAPDGGTILNFEAIGSADGGIMRLGKALIGNSAQKVIDGFFESIGREMAVHVRPIARPEASDPSAVP